MVLVLVYEIEGYKDYIELVKGNEQLDFNCTLIINVTPTIKFTSIYDKRLMPHINHFLEFV